MPKTAPSRWFRYGGAALAVILATLVRLLLDPVMRDTRPLVTYLPAIMFTAWAFGSGPTLLSAFLSVAAAVFFFVDPRYSFGVKSSADQVGFLIFLVFGMVAALFSEQLYRARERGEWRQLQEESARALQEAHDQLEQRVKERTLELTEAQNSLRQSEERFQAFMDHLPAGAWILDDDSRCVFVNRFYSSMTGLDLGCVVGKTAYDLYPPEIAVQHQANDRLVREVGNGLELEEPYIRPDGTPGELLVVKFPIPPSAAPVPGSTGKDAAGLLIGGVAIDVTERKRAEDRLRRLTEQLVSAEDTERRRLAADLHDSIGQSLSLLKLNLESLATECPALTAHVKLLDSIIKQTRTLMFELYPSMLHDLGLVPTLLWYGEQLSAQAGSGQGRASQAQVTVTEIGKPWPLTLPVASYLFRAAKEILGNAIRHGRAREIVVAAHWRAQADGSRSLKIVIDDDGCGFEPAKVLAPQTQRGLGLAGIRERLLSLSGKMQIESEPGRGTRIILDVPLNGNADADG